MRIHFPRSTSSSLVKKQPSIRSARAHVQYLFWVVLTLILNAAKRSERALNCIGISSDSQVAPRVTSDFSSTQLRDHLRSVFFEGREGYSSRRLESTPC